MKLSLKAAILSALAVAGLRGVPARAQNAPASIFQVVPTPNSKAFNNSLFAASASSPNDIWAVGDSTIHFDGTKFTLFQAPLINGDNTAFLEGVVDISPTQAWAVGNVVDGANLGQIIEQWNGTEWTLFPNPKLPPNSQADLFGISAISANDIWAVGNFVEDSGLDFNLFEHWDGAAWTATTKLAAGFEALSGVSADSTDDAWAVGFQESDSIATFATHWNGTSWQSVTTPNVGSGTNQLNAVLALAPDNVWAVGLSTPTLHAATLTLIEHFDGTSWTVVPSPNVGPNSPNQSNRLFGLAANSANDIWAFGSFFAANGSGHQMTLLLHWDGTAWTIAPSPDPTSGDFLDDILFAGVVPSSGNIWIFGNEDEAHGQGSLAIHTTTGDRF
jgi:hypothetical protein